MEGKFTQKGLESGLADILLIREEDESICADDGIILARASASGAFEYLGRDKGQWGGKKETLRAEATLKGDTISFRLEPFYVNCLSKGGHLVTLVDRDGKEKYEIPVFIDGVKKSSLGRETVEPASPSPRNEAQECVEAIVALKKEAESLEGVLLSQGNVMRDAQKLCMQLLSEGKTGEAEKARETMRDAFSKSEQTKKELAALLASARNTLQNEKLSMDAVRWPEAQEAVHSVEEYVTKAERILELEKDACSRAEEAFSEKEDEAARLQREAEEARLFEEEKRDAHKTEKAEDAPKKKTGLIVGVILLLCALAGGAAYYMTQQKGDEPKIAANTAEDDAASAKKAEEAEREAAEKARLEAEKQRMEEEKRQAEEAAKKEAERRAQKADARGRVGAFFASENRNPKAAMELAADLDASTTEQQDAIFRLYYYAAEEGMEEAYLPYAQCVDPSKPAWGSIKKDAAEAWYYYGKTAQGKALQTELEAWVKDAAEKGDPDARKWLQEMK